MKRVVQIAIGLAAFFVVACGVDAGTGGAAFVPLATPTPRPTTAIELHAGERFTVVCVDTGSVIMYGDNGTKEQPATGIAGVCE